MKATYILRQNTRSSEFGANYIEKYINCLNIGFGQFDFMVIDAQTNKVLVFESYEIDNVQTYPALIEVLKTIYEKHDCLPAGFWKKIIVNISTAKHTLIPEKFFSEENASAFLKLNTSLDADSESTAHVPIKKQNTVSSFAFPNDLKNWLESIYPKNLVFTHDVASFLTGLSESPEQLVKNNLFVLIKKDYLHLVIFKGGKIEFANSFLCQTVNDFIYYVLMISEEVKLNRSETTVYFYGTADDRSAFFVETQKYFAQVTLGKAPKGIEFTSDTEQFPVNASYEILGSYFI